ncbi:unnamed protein product, partial [Owenia fusiformis]
MFNIGTMFFYQLLVALLLNVCVTVHGNSNATSLKRTELEEMKNKNNCKLCTCVGLIADCTSRNLKSLPQDLPQDITTLNLTNNSITHLPDGLLGQLYQSLKVLDIDGNKITAFGQYVFDGLQNLEFLGIGANPFKPELFHHLVYKPLKNIRTIFVSRFGDESKHDSRIPLFNAFEGLQNSTIEAIIYEHITFVPFLLEKKYMQFFQNCHLKKLVLPENKIYAFEPGFSKFMPHLEIVDVSRNLIQGTMPVNNKVLEIYLMQFLKVIKIEGNTQG